MCNSNLKTPLYSNFMLPWPPEIMEYWSTGVPKMSYVYMKITPEISALVENMDIFRNLRHMLSFWIYSGVNKMSVVGTGGLQERVSFFNIFTRIFAY